MAKRIEDEIKDRFKTDEKIYSKSLMEIAQYFFEQGRNRERFAREGLKAKLEHYRQEIGKRDFEHLKSIDKEWFGVMANNKSEEPKKDDLG